MSGWSAAVRSSRGTRNRRSLRPSSCARASLNIHCSAWLLFMFASFFFLSFFFVSFIYTHYVFLRFTMRCCRSPGNTRAHYYDRPGPPRVAAALGRGNVCTTRGIGPRFSTASPYHDDDDDNNIL